MISYVPANIITAALGGYVPAWHDYMPLYEHLARTALDMGLPRETLVATSAIHLHDFAEITCQADIIAVLARVFLAVGRPYGRGRLLRKLGIRKWADLAKPLRIRGRQCKAGLAYDVRERRLKEPHNECHPEAMYGQRAFYQFCPSRRRWRFHVEYGYSRDMSTWTITLYQGREALSTLVDQRVPEWIDSLFEADAWDRPDRNREYDRFLKAVCQLWARDYARNADMSTIDTLVAALVDAGWRPTLTPRRLAVLRRWIAADRKEADDG